MVEPRDDLVLRMEHGRIAHFRPKPVPPPAGRPGMAGPRVLLYRGEPEGEPVSEHALLWQGDLLVFGGWEPGTWTLWIDPGGARAPLVIRGAVLGGENVDLGEVDFPEGGRIRVRVLVREGTAAPRVSGWVQREAAPRYLRYADAGRETDSGGVEVLVGGLGAGKFLLQVGPVMGAPGGKGALREEIESDGASEIERTLDLR